MRIVRIVQAVVVAAVLLASTPTIAFDWEYAGAMVVMNGMMIMDVERTMKCYHEGWCVEGNGIMAPVIKSGRPATYAVQGAANLALMKLAWSAKKQGGPAWLVVPLIATGIHGIGVRVSFTIPRPKK